MALALGPTLWVIADDPPVAVAGLIDTARLAAGLPRLAPAIALADTGARYAAVLAGRGRLTHGGPGEPLSRYREAGGTATRVGEILGAGADIGSVSDAWLASFGHREVMLDPAWTHVGVGVTRLPATLVIVVMFATHGITGVVIDAGLATLSGQVVGNVSDPTLLVGGEWITPCRHDPASGTVHFCLPPGVGGLVQFAPTRRPLRRITDVWWLAD